MKMRLLFVIRLFLIVLCVTLFSTCAIPFTPNYDTAQLTKVVFTKYYSGRIDLAEPAEKELLQRFIDTDDIMAIMKEEFAITPTSEKIEYEVPKAHQLIHYDTFKDIIQDMEKLSGFSELGYSEFTIALAPIDEVEYEEWSNETYSPFYRDPYALIFNYESPKQLFITLY